MIQSEKVPVRDDRDRPPTGTGRWGRVAVLSVMLVLGLSLRLVHITALPYDFHVDRQYFDALTAQAEYDDATHAAVPLRRAADANRRYEGDLEPPIMEQIAVWGYEIVGHEDLTIPLVAAAVIWVAGAIFLYLLVVRLVSPSAAFVAVAFDLFAPFAVAASRAFMPDPLMVSLALLAVYLALRYHQAPSRGLLALAALAGAAAIWAKPMSVFVVAPAFGAFHLARKGWRTVLSGDLLAFVVGAGAPPGAFYLYEYLSGSFEKGAGTRLVLSIFTKPSFWHQWIQMVDAVLRVGSAVPGEAVIVLCFLGVLASRGWARTLLVALFAGYLLFGLVFATHIYDSDYYSLSLDPIAGIALGCLATWTLDRLRRWRPMTAIAAPVVLVVLCAGYVAVSRGSLYTNLSAPQAQVPSPALDRRIGAVVDHSTRVLFLAQNFGETVAYYGGVASDISWPSSADLSHAAINGDAAAASLSVSVRMARIISQYHPRWFVITWTSQLRQQPALQPYLAKHFLLAAHSPSYLVYDLAAVPRGHTVAGG